MLFVLMFFNYVDRVNVGFAAFLFLAAVLALVMKAEPKGRIAPVLAE